MHQDVRIKKPKRGRKVSYEPPVEEKMTRNLSQPETNSTVTLNFRVSPEFKKDFKSYCAENGFSMNYFLVEAFARLKDELRK